MKLQGCQSKNHEDCDTDNGLWECDKCHKKFCMNEGCADEYSGLCDDCWVERMEHGLVSHDPIPDAIKESLERYEKHHIATGSFLRAVLSNNLFLAIGKADKENKKIIPEIVDYIWNNLDENCYGSIEKVNNWVNNKGV